MHYALTRAAIVALLLVAVAATAPPAALAQAPGAAPASQPAATIRGLVVDERTEQPLARVLVRLADTGHRAITGPDGRFELRGVRPGDYTVTVSVVGYALLRKAVTAAAGAVLDFTFVLTAGAGTYEEKVDVVAPIFEAREPGTVAEQTIGAIELQDLRVLVADDPMRAVQALPGATTTDDYSAEFSARGSGPRHTGILLDGVPASAVLLHAVEGRDDSGSIARISTDALSQASLLLGSYPQRAGDRLGPQLEFTTRDGSRDGFHLRATVSMIAAAAMAEGPIGGGRGSWLVTVRQSYLDSIIRRLYSNFNSFLGFTDAQGKVVFDLSPRHQASLIVLGGRSHFEELHTTPGPNSLSDANTRGGLAIAGLRSTGQAWLLNQRAYFLVNRYRNERVDGVDLESGRYGEAGYRANLSRMFGRRLTVEAGGHVQQTAERAFAWSYDSRVPPRRTTIESYDVRKASGGAYTNVRWQAATRLLLTTGARIDASAAVSRTTASPWAQVETRLPGGLLLKAGSGIYRQVPSFEYIYGAHGGGDDMVPERAYHADLGLEQRLGAHARWQLSFYNREEHDVVFASGLEPRAAGAAVPYNPLAKYDNRLDGYARGVEAMLQRRDANGLSGWIAYTYGKARYTDARTGEAFDGDYDSRQTLNVYTSLRLSSRTTAVAKYRVGSNIPVRGYYKATGVEDSDGLPTFVAGTSRNAERLPAYARLDLRLNQVFDFSTRRLTLFIELINVTNRTNGGLTGGRRVEKLLPFIPAAGFLVEF